jgi:hypothetical protein
MPIPEEFATMDPARECVCGYPLSMHSTDGARFCSRWECGCTRFTTPAEMEELNKARLSNSRPEAQ